MGRAVGAPGGATNVEGGGVTGYPYATDAAEFDLAVIGAGINGVAIARDAAMRGLRVIVIDKSDIGSGTTSRPTRLIHGGLRYLEHFEVPLVRESLHERNTLLRTAPHLVRPLHFLIPLYAAGSRSARIVRLGMVAYEVLSFGNAAVGHHRMLSAQETLHLAPGLDPEGLRGGALYYDAQAVYPERLALENALSAREYGALVLTYTRAEGFEVAADRAVAVRLREERTGRASTVRAAVIMNAGGPWADEVLAGLPGERPRLIGGTKGSHLIVGAFPGAPTMAVYTEATDNRPYFIVPWAGNYLIGTTDERFDGDPDEAIATTEEIDYLIDSTNEAIPAAHLTRDDVQWTYSGVRPLPYEPGVPEAKVTRKHVFRQDERVRNIISVVGGKLTTHRSLAEQAVDLVFELLGRRAPRSRTADEPLPGGRTGDWDRFADGFRSLAGLPGDVTDHLLGVYGARAADVLDYAATSERLRATVPGTSTLAAEIPFAVRREMTTTLTDLYLRRTMLGVRGDLGLDTLDDVTGLAAACLGWDGARAAAEAGSYRQTVAHYHPGRISSGLSR
ncbi:MAG TPA: glycerol-3-phosphate dehydrogenase/oxidase [Streptosporangiaceae bacterium]|nr:glycerol-3-phosphate dehydrogenase/oxidase [Streptosporangiaceae bacterium]